MQIAACPNVEYVSTDQIPQDVVEREKSIELGRDDLAGKKEEMKVKIVEGRIGKRLKELTLLDQPFIRDNALTVGEMVKQAAGKTGENIQVRRFTRYTLGEGIEVETTDFAAEVAAMGGKAA
jgi:elongation factor Ts